MEFMKYIKNTIPETSATFSTWMNENSDMYNLHYKTHYNNKKLTFPIKELAFRYIICYNNKRRVYFFTLTKFDWRLTKWLGTMKRYFITFIL